MALSPGTRIGSYEVTAQIGLGSMGEVYRATDTNLKRQVAIKVLPAVAAADVERLARFQREAEVLAALNHPNIAQIHGLEKSDGTIALVMELVEGPTLADRIAEGPIPVDEALLVATQIAGALEAAHERRIIHRDLKPANVKVRPDGTVKVLDFGLAKAIEPSGLITRALSESPTITSPAMTKAGVILGTAAYMSPEQARGQAVDTRTDIWSFGCVLFEMLSGRRAFPAGTLSDTLVAVLQGKPDWRALPAGLPNSIRTLLQRCLEKDPKQRLHDIADARLELVDALQSPTQASTTPNVPSRLGVRWAAWVGLAILLVMVSVLALRYEWFHRPATRPDVSAALRLTSDSGLSTDPALSADGKLLAFASDRGQDNLDIWVKQVGATEALRLTTHESDDREPDLSPDGQRIVFRSDRDGGGIHIVSTLGGDERRIAEGGRRPRFSPDGKWIAYWVGSLGADFAASGGSKVYVIPSGGGPAQPIATDLAGTRFPVWSPDGTRLLLYGLAGWKEQGAGEEDWWVVPRERGPAIKTGAMELFRRQKLALRRTDGAAAWTADNHIIFSARVGDSTNVWQVPISGTYQVAGNPERLTTGTGHDVSPAVAHSGPAGSLRLVFASLNENIDLWGLSFRGPDGANQGRVTSEMRRLTQDITLDGQPALTRDGKVLVYVSRRSGSFDLWRKGLDDDKESVVAATPWHETHPAISADGSTVAYLVDGNQRSVIDVVVRGGPARTVCDGCFLPWDLSSNGSQLLFWSLDQRRVGLVDLASGGKADLLRHSEYAVLHAVFSPDDRWISFLAIGGSARRIFIAPFSGPARVDERLWIAVIDGLSESTPRWSPDGNLIYFTSFRDGFECFWAQRLDARTKKPRGSAFPVHHIHSARRSLGNVTVFWQELGVATDKLVFPLNDQTANIWMIERSTVPARAPS